MSEIELCVSGMSCAVCASRVSKALLSLSGVKDAEVSLISNKALVVFDSTRVNKDEIIAAVKNAGYGASVLKNNTQNSSSDVKNTKFKLISGLLLTIILIFIASSVMFNIIIFKSALYYFVIEALLCLLVMYLQKDFFIRAVKALKKGETSMDTLVSLGSFVSFAYSLSMGSFLKNDTLITEFVIAHPLYFESAAGILCFVALGRYLEKKCRFKTSSVISSLYALNPEKVCIKKDGQEVLSSPDEVKPGSIVIIRAGERISVDGEVISGHGFVNESSLTGESTPVEVAAGFNVKAATLLEDGYLEVKSLCEVKDTAFFKIVRAVEKSALSKSPVSRIADRVSAVFVPCVMALALITFLIWFYVFDLEFYKALNFAVSVLVISCPCALGIATPAAVVAAVYRGAKSGIIFKSPEGIEKLSKVKHFAFDKTGTLSTGNFRVKKVDVYDSMHCEDEVLRLAASLESSNSHQIAKTIVMASKRPLYEVHNYSYKILCGVSGFIGKDKYVLGNNKVLSDGVIHNGQKLNLNDEDKSSLNLYLLKNDSLIGSIALVDELKADVVKTISLLHREKVSASVISGDSKDRVEAVKNAVAADLAFASLTAVEKADKINQLKSTYGGVAMTGDGINDAVALTEADISISIKGATDIAVSACDVILLNAKSLIDVYNAFYLSKRALKIIKQNLFFAFAYNVLFIPVAAGLFYRSMNLCLSPLICSVLMGLSSVCVVSNAMRLGTLKLEDKKNIEPCKDFNVPVCDVAEGRKKKMKEITLKIEGMMCAHCEASVKKALSKIDGLEVISVSAKDGEAKIKAGFDDLSDKIKSSVEDLDFTLKDIISD